MTATRRSVHGGAGFAVTLIASTFLMGSSFVAGKILLHGGFPPMILVGWRFLVAALATLPLVRFDHRGIIGGLFPPKAGLRDLALAVSIGLLQTAAVMGLVFLAMTSISASTAAILIFTNPIWVALLSRLFLGEALHGVRIAGLILGMAGVTLALGPDPNALAAGAALQGEFISILAALCWAAATVVNKRANSQLGSWALSFWQMLIGAVTLLAIAYAKGKSWPASTSPAQWGWFLWLAIPASTGSFGLWFVALARGGATRTSGYLFLAPLFAVILSFFVLGTVLSWLQVGGGLLIGIALWLVNREPPARNSRERLEEARAEGQP